LSPLTLRYVELGWDLFPVAGKHPMVEDWPTVATTDIGTLEGWVRRWPYRQWGRALSPDTVVADPDMHVGENGIADLLRLDGRDPRDVETPTATTPSGGLHILFASNGWRYKNGRIAGTAIDVKANVGFIVLPETYPDGSTNGREWLRKPWDTPLASAPPWMDVATRREPTSSPAEAPDFPLPEYDENFARAALVRACIRIAYAPCGEQDNTRNAESFFIGLLVGRGLLDRDEALAALTRAALAMPTYGKPWRDLEKRVEKSLEAGERVAP
jgi:hypothetical protein